MLKNLKTSRLAITGLLFCLVLFLSVSGQIKHKKLKYNQAQKEFDNGNIKKAIKLAKIETEKSRKAKNKKLTLKGLLIVASSQISVRKYAEAEQILNEALQLRLENSSDNQKAIIYLQFARLFRSQYKFTKAIDFSKKAVKVFPNNRQIQGEHFLNIARILFVSGYDVSAIIWLEKAEKSLEQLEVNSAKLNVYRYLTLAWWSKLNYPKTLEYANKWVSSSENTQYKYKHRQALYQLGSIQNAIGQKQSSLKTLQKGLDLSINQKNHFQTLEYLSYLLFSSLDEKDDNKASLYLQRLEKADKDKIFNFEINLGKAVLSTLKGQSNISENMFAKLDKMDKPSAFMLPHWKIFVAEHNKNWTKMLKFNQSLLDLTLKDNYRQDLPEIYLNFAKAYFNLNQIPRSLENINKSISIIEEMRDSENTTLSLSIYETYHKAYRLLTELKSKDVLESFKVADFLKARFLRDKINNSIYREKTIVSPIIRKKLEELSLKYFEIKMPLQKLVSMKNLLQLQFQI